MGVLSDNAIKACLAEYGVEASAPQCEQIRLYIALLSKWNRSISLTSLTDQAEILRFHFGESLFALPAAGSINGRLADVGTGAGFPGLPLRIFSERIEPFLIESSSKKCAFLSEVARQINLDAHVVRARYEGTKESFRGNLDVIVSRALGGYVQLLHWAEVVLAPSGKIILWLGEDEANRLISTRGWLWQAKIPIPASRKRFLLLGSRGPREAMVDCSTWNSD